MPRNAPLNGLYSLFPEGLEPHRNSEKDLHMVVLAQSGGTSKLCSRGIAKGFGWEGCVNPFSPKLQERIRQKFDLGPASGTGRSSRSDNGSSSSNSSGGGGGVSQTADTGRGRVGHHNRTVTWIRPRHSHSHFHGKPLEQRSHEDDIVDPAEHEVLEDLRKRKGGFCKHEPKALLDRMSGFMRTLPAEQTERYAKLVHRVLTKGTMSSAGSEAVDIIAYEKQLHALRHMCLAAWTPNGHRGYGIVAHRDASSSESKWGYALSESEEALGPIRAQVQVDVGASLLRLFHDWPQATVFNLAPARQLCGDSLRTAAWTEGQCLLPSQFDDGLSFAIAYNLEKACSDRFLEIQDSQVGCLPPELGLFSGVDGYSAVAATVPFFEVPDARERHRKELPPWSPTVRSAALWREFIRERQAKCVAPVVDPTLSDENDADATNTDDDQAPVVKLPTTRCGQSVADASSKCGESCAHDHDCPMPNDKCFDNINPEPCRKVARVETMTEQDQHDVRLSVDAAFQKYDIQTNEGVVKVDPTIAGLIAREIQHKFASDEKQPKNQNDHEFECECHARRCFKLGTFVLQGPLWPAVAGGCVIVSLAWGVWRLSVHLKRRRADRPDASVYAAVPSS